MAVTREDVEHVAHLARLALDQGLVPELVAQLNGILQHMEVLSQLDTTGVVATTGVGEAGLPLREDDGEQIPLLLPREAFAPGMRDGFFVVPRLASHEDADETAE